MHASFFKLINSVTTRAAAFAIAAGLAGCASDGTADLRSIPGAGVTIYAAGDIADCQRLPPAFTGAAQTANLLAPLLAADSNAAVLSLGDNTYPVGQPGEFTDCYQPTWGRFKSRIYPSPGNHEYYTKGAPGYYGYFSNATGPGQRGYFSVDLGKWHVISLNSNLRDEEFLTQLAWLKTDLEQHKSLCTLAYWHHPMYSSGGHGNNPFMTRVWKALAEAGADVVLVSHDHDYERFAPQDGDGKLDRARGIRQFVVGTGGAQLTPIWRLKPNSERSNNSTHGVLKMVLKDTGYEWEFLPTTTGGFTDSGAAPCH
jgi:hypothetical protein